MRAMWSVVSKLLRDNVPASATRRAVILHALLAAYPVKHLLQPQAASCAVPSISEYDSVQYKPRALDGDAVATYKGRTFALGQNVKREDVEVESLSAAVGLDRLLMAMQRVEVLVTARAFEDARLTLRTPLFADVLGFNPGIRGYQSNPKPSTALLENLPPSAASPLEDALVSLKALDDFLLVNRVIFFNVEDMVQVSLADWSNLPAECRALPRWPNGIDPRSPPREFRVRSHRCKNWWARTLAGSRPSR